MCGLERYASAYDTVPDHNLADCRADCDSYHRRTHAAVRSLPCGHSLPTPAGMANRSLQCAAHHAAFVSNHTDDWVVPAQARTAA